MCHRGCMFAPIKIWHKWHVKTNLNQKIYVTVSLLAASSISDLVLTHGHRIEECYSLNLLQLAPGGHLGNLLSGLKVLLDDLFGTYRRSSFLMKYFQY
ncbi:13885_t:CDS:2 [Entrophospora sp. SA101]|nr:13885_t:CDS:2 [Entrophospora sp. SA101]CAJ0852048.1 7164_t:CDS:2 [Entrophospora sp. SA101]